MNPYTRNLNRIEFVVTYACTGRCKHCSEGEHKRQGEYIDGEAAAEAVYKTAEKYKMDSLMTFGGEPLLYPDVVCNIHKAGKEAGIPKRQLITNGFFSKENEKIEERRERERGGKIMLFMSVCRNKEERKETSFTQVKKKNKLLFKRGDGTT